MTSYIILFFLVVNLIPFIRKFLRITSTMFHEIGHALMALFCSGKVHRIYLYKDASGAAVTSNENWISRFLTSLAGYPAEVLVVSAFIHLLYSQSEKIILIILIATTLFSLLFVRNIFGWLWVLVIGGFSVAAFVNISEPWPIYFLLFLTVNMLVENIFSSMIICWRSCKYPKDAGDTTSLAHLTKIPAFLWGMVFLGFTTYIIATTLPYFFHIKMPI